jgi:hypothetical protein
MYHSLGVLLLSSTLHKRLHSTIPIAYSLIPNGNNDDGPSVYNNGDGKFCSFCCPDKVQITFQNGFAHNRLQSINPKCRFTNFIIITLFGGRCLNSLSIGGWIMRRHRFLCDHLSLSKLSFFAFSCSFFS